MTSQERRSLLNEHDRLRAGLWAAVHRLQRHGHDEDAERIKTEYLTQPRAPRDTPGLTQERDTRDGLWWKPEGTP